MDYVRAWLNLATHPSVLKRSLVTCGIVGTVLVAINHSDAVLRASIDPGTAVQIVLTFLVPFLVSTTSSIAAIRAQGTSSVRHARISPSWEQAEVREELRPGHEAD